MDGALKFLLLTGFILLVYTDTFIKYTSLTSDLQKEIDKVLKKANSIFGGEYYVGFHSFIEPKEKTNRNNLQKHLNVQLIVTTCKKTSKDAYEHREECDQRKNKTPLIDCLVCTTHDDKELIDCGRLHYVQKNMRDKFRQNCKSYLIGSGSLFQKSEDKRQVGCIGCV